MFSCQRHVAKKREKSRVELLFVTDLLQIEQFHVTVLGF